MVEEVPSNFGDQNQLWNHRSHMILFMQQDQHICIDYITPSLYFFAPSGVSRIAYIMGRQWAVITGAANGIGYALTQELLTRCPDMRILAVDKDGDGLKKLAKKCPYIVQTVSLDLAEESAVENISKAIPEDDEVAILVHNAALVCATVWGEITRDLADYAFAVNATAPLLLTKELFPRLQEAKGRVLYIGATFGQRPEVGYCLYGLTKAAGFHLCKTLNVEFAGTGVISAYVLPGGIDTEAFHHDAQKAFELKLPFGKILKKVLNGGLKTPKYAAKFLAFLLLDTEDEEFKANTWNIKHEFHLPRWDS